MVLELLQVMRRWPSIAAALSVHALAIATLVLSPTPHDTTIWIDTGPLPPLSPPRSSGSAASAGAARTERAPRPEKDFTKAMPTPDVAPPPSTAEPVVSVAMMEVTPADATSSDADVAFGEGDGSGSPEGTATGRGAPGSPDGMGRDPEAGSAGQPRPAAAEAIRMTSQVDPPQLIRRVEPHYPPLARVHGVEGEVVLECIIGSDGSVRVARILRSVPLLDAAAAAAVERWRYAAALRDGQPQAVYLSVRVSFSLGG